MNETSRLHNIIAMHNLLVVLFFSSSECCQFVTVSMEYISPYRIFKGCMTLKLPLFTFLIHVPVHDSLNMLFIIFHQDDLEILLKWLMSPRPF